MVMANDLAFVTKRVLHALVLFAFAAIGLAAPQQAFAASEYLNLAANRESATYQLRFPNQRALDRPNSDCCALTRKWVHPRVGQKQTAAANADGEVPANTHAILTASYISSGKSGQEWLLSLTDQPVFAGHLTAFRSRGPPSLNLV